jgi:hypothetical protein
LAGYAPLTGSIVFGTTTPTAANISFATGSGSTVNFANATVTNLAGYAPLSGAAAFGATSVITFTSGATVNFANATVSNLAGYVPLNAAAVFGASSAITFTSGASINFANATLSNIPASAITGLTTDTAPAQNKLVIYQDALGNRGTATASSTTPATLSMPLSITSTAAAGLLSLTGTTSGRSSFSITNTFGTVGGGNSIATGVTFGPTSGNGIYQFGNDSNQNGTDDFFVYSSTSGSQLQRWTPTGISMNQLVTIAGGGSAATTTAISPLTITGTTQNRLFGLTMQNTGSSTFSISTGVQFGSGVNSWSLVNDTTMNNANNFALIATTGGTVETWTPSLITMTPALLANSGLSAPFSNSSFITSGSLSSTTSCSIVMQACNSGAQGLSFIGFNGYWSGSAEVRLNTAKNRWRYAVDQRSTTDQMFIDTYNGTTNLGVLTINASDQVIRANVGHSSPTYNMTSTASQPTTAGTNNIWVNSQNTLCYGANQLIGTFATTWTAGTGWTTTSPSNVVTLYNAIGVNKMVFTSNVAMNNGTTQNFILINIGSGAWPTGFAPTANGILTSCFMSIDSGLSWIACYATTRTNAGQAQLLITQARPGSSTIVTGGIPWPNGSNPDSRNVLIIDY